jgi:hypothetical protein
MSENNIGAVDSATCRNCGALAPLRYCPECGQKTDTSVPTLGEFLGDLFRSLTDFDSRIWRTLGMLLRPGRLTLVYLEGQRARYVSPMRLYLAVSVVTFLVFALPDRVNFDAAAGPDAEVGLRLDTDDPDPDPDTAAALQDALAADGPDSTRRGPRGCTMNFGAFSDSAAAQRLQANCERVFSDRDAIRDLFTAFNDNFPLLAFLIIPVMAGFFRLFYLSSGKAYLEHLAFLIHNHTFMLCFMALVDLFMRIDDLFPALANPVQLTALVLPWICILGYFFMATRRVYGESRLKTFVKFVLLVPLYGVVASSIFAAGFFVTLLLA